MTAHHFDFRNPDYGPVFLKRVERLKYIRSKPEILPALRTYYKTHIPDFINDWGCTFDPRSVADTVPAVVPFLLFPKQREFLEWVDDSWRNRRNGVCPKSRESGVSWLAISWACSMALFNDGFVAGFGSRKEEYVDKVDDPKSLFWKARKFVELLPAEFRGGWNRKTDAPHMRILFRETDSFITGEAGDNIGRGDRTSIYFVDEAAFLSNPKSVDASLSQTTRCKIEVSTAHGMNNPFYGRVARWANTDRVFRFHWRDDPRKDDEWYRQQQEELDPVVLAQEVDIDFAASVEGVLIPTSYVQAAVDAHVKLGFHPSGLRAGALDVADEGRDKNAFCGAHGVVLEHLEEWSGKGDDIFGTTERAFKLCDDLKYAEFQFDSDGLGAGVRGDARVINERRLTQGQKQISAVPFRGSEGVLNPEAEDVKGRKNADYFANRKAQMYWSLRLRFEKTYRMVQGIQKYSHDELISIPSSLPMRERLCQELSQPTFSVNGAGKLLVDKTPTVEGKPSMPSPNLADAVMIRMARTGGMLRIDYQGLMQASRTMKGRR